MNTQKIISLGRNLPQPWRRYSRIVLNSFRHRIFPNLWAYFVDGGKGFYPRAISLEITYRCNLRCKMCLYHRAGQLNKKNDEISLEEIVDLIHTVKRWRPSICLSGGEPFLRKDILEIVASIKKERLSCGVITNGTLMDENDCKKMVELGLDSISFSIDGIGAVHDSIRGVKGSYQKAVNNIISLNCAKKERKESAPDIFINCVITKDNIQSLEKMVEVAKKLKVGLQYQHVMFLEKETICQHEQALIKDFPDRNDELLEGFAHRQGELDSHFLVEKIKEIKRQAGKLNRIVKFLPDLNERDIINYYTVPNWWHSYWCLSPWIFVTISPGGDVYPCLQLKMGNIRDNSLEEIWNGEAFQRFRNRIKKTLYPRCQRCCRLGSRSI